MSDKSNKYGYVGVDIPAQSFGNNKGVFNPAEINELVANNKWTQFGQLELIETQNISTSTAYIDFTNLGNYNVHFMTINDGAHSSAVNYIRIRFIENGTLQSGSVYQYANQMNQAYSGAFERRSTGNTSIEHTQQLASGGGNLGNSYCYFYNLKDSSKYSFTSCHSIASYGDAEAGFGSGVMAQASLVDGIRVYAGGGVNWTRVNISLYGIRYS